MGEIPMTTNRSRHYLLDLIEEERYLSESILLQIEEYTKSFKNIPVSDSIRKNEIIPLLELLNKYHSYDNFHKGRVWAYLESVKNKKAIDLFTVSDHRKRQRVYQLLSSVLEKKNIGIIPGSLSYEELKEIGELFVSHSISPSELINKLNDTDYDMIDDIHSLFNSYPTELIDKLITLSDKVFLYSSILDSTQSTVSHCSSPSDIYDIYDIDISRYIQGYTQKGGGVGYLNATFDENMNKIEKIIEILSKIGVFLQSEKVILGNRLFLEKSTSLLIHLSKSNSEDGWIPISKNFLIHNKLDSLTSTKLANRKSQEVNSSLYVLKELGLIEVRGYDAKSNKSREVKLTNLGLAITGILSTGIKRPKMRELEFTPGDINEDIQDWKFYADRFIPNVDLLKKTIDSFSPAKIHLPNYISEMKSRNPILGLSSDDYKIFVLENLEQIENDVIPIDMVTIGTFHRDIDLLTTGHNLKQNSKTREWEIRSTFTLSYTGRLFARNGVQGIAKISKSVIHEGKFNYDIPNSQIRVLVQEFEKVKTRFWNEFSETERQYCEEGLKHLIEYRDGDLKKEDIARNLRISVDDWKKCLYTLVFGGPLSASPETSIGSIMNKYKFVKGFNPTKLYKELDKFKRPINIWLNYCQRFYIEYELTAEQEVDFNRAILAMDADISKYDPNDYCYNGVVFLSKYSDIFLDSKKLSSFILQGIESSFIFHLGIALNDRNAGIEVISYEFDGIVTSKPIPEKYINYAREKSGFTTGQVLVKGFDKSLED